MVLLSGLPGKQGEARSGEKLFRGFQDHRFSLDQDAPGFGVVVAVGCGTETTTLKAAKVASLTKGTPVELILAKQIDAGATKLEIGRPSS